MSYVEKVANFSLEDQKKTFNYSIKICERENALQLFTTTQRSGIIIVNTKNNLYAIHKSRVIWFHNVENLIRNSFYIKCSDDIRELVYIYYIGSCSENPFVYQHEIDSILYCLVNFAIKIQISTGKIIGLEKLNRKAYKRDIVKSELPYVFKKMSTFYFDDERIRRFSNNKITERITRESILSKSSVLISTMYSIYIFSIETNLFNLLFSLLPDSFTDKIRDFVVIKDSVFIKTNQRSLLLNIEDKSVTELPHLGNAKLLTKFFKSKEFWYIAFSNEEGVTILFNDCSISNVNVNVIEGKNATFEAAVDLKGNMTLLVRIERKFSNDFTDSKPNWSNYIINIKIPEMYVHTERLPRDFFGENVSGITYTKEGNVALYSNGYLNYFCVDKMEETIEDEVMDDFVKFKDLNSIFMRNLELAFDYKNSYFNKSNAYAMLKSISNGYLKIETKYLAFDEKRDKEINEGFIELIRKGKFNLLCYLLFGFRYKRRTFLMSSYKLIEALCRHDSKTYVPMLTNNEEEINKNIEIFIKEEENYLLSIYKDILYKKVKVENPKKKFEEIAKIVKLLRQIKGKILEKEKEKELRKFGELGDYRDYESLEEYTESVNKTCEEID